MFSGKFHIKPIILSDIVKKMSVNKKGVCIVFVKFERLTDERT